MERIALRSAPDVSCSKATAVGTWKLTGLQMATVDVEATVEVEALSGNEKSRVSSSVAEGKRSLTVIKKGWTCFAPRI